MVPSTLKVTEPDGVPAPGAWAVTAAVKLSCWPKTDGLTDDPTATVALALFTVWVAGAEVELPLKLTSPV